MKAVGEKMTKYYQEEPRVRSQFELQLAAATERKLQVYGLAGINAWLPGYGYCVTCGFDTPVDAVGMRGGQGYCAEHLHTFDRYVGIRLDGVWEERCVTCGGPPGLTECKPDPGWRARYETALAKHGPSDPRHHHGWPTPAAPPLDDYQPLWSRALVCPLFVP